MVGSPTKPGNWGNWATIHGYGIYESEYDQSQISKTNTSGKSAEHIPCIFAKVSGHSWCICTCEKSAHFKQKCNKRCINFMESKAEALANSPPKKRGGQEDWSNRAIKITQKKKHSGNKKKFHGSAKTYTPSHKSSTETKSSLASSMFLTAKPTYNALKKKNNR